VVDFKTSKQHQTARIVETLERLYAGKPVGSVAIGNACNVEHAQVPIRREAKKIEKAQADLNKRREQIEQRMRQA